MNSVYFHRIQEYVLTHFYLFVFRGKPGKLIFIDIDHTLADTAMILGPRAKIHKVDYAIFQPMYQLVKDLFQQNEKVYFLSARQLSTYLITRRWLAAIGLKKYTNRLLFAKSPMHKVNLIRRLTKRGWKITLIDDMAYNYDRGQPDFYTLELKALNQLQIVHLYFYFINRLNKTSLAVKN